MSELRRLMREFLWEEDAVGVVEIILILVDKSTHAYRVYRERKKPKKQTIYTLYTIKRDYKVFKKGK